MSSNYNPDFPSQSPFNTYIDDNSEPNDQSYVEKQNNLIRGQRHEKLGQVPSYASLISSDNILQQVRYHVIAPNFRNSDTLLQPYHGDSHRAHHEHHDAHGEYHNHHGHSDGDGDSHLNDDHLASLYSGPNKDYNKYIDYLSRRGYLNDNYKTRIYTNYINIDSRWRNKEPSLTKENDILLGNDPLTFTTAILNTIVSSSKVNLLTITMPGHDFVPNDRITLSGVVSDPVSIKALYQYTNFDGTDKTAFAVIFENGSKSIAIKTDYAISVLWNSFSNSYFQEDSPETANMSFDPNFVVGDGISYDKLKAYDTSDMYVDLSGFVGTTNIGNIPVSFLNSTHRIYLSNPDPSGDVFINTPDGSGIVRKITGFYILLPYVFNSPSNPPLTDTTMTIDINFRYIGGLPINQLNANIPISNDNVYGYFTVYSTTTNKINVKLNKDTYYINSTQPDKVQLGPTPIPFGGDSVFIARITNIDNAYPEQNSYVIDLPKSIHNVFMIKLVNTIFPNVSKTFRTNMNNKLYWQNLEDGLYTYVISIPEGNYTAKELELVLEQQMYAITRNEVSATQPNPGGYTNKVLFDVTIDPNTSIVSFKSYKEAMLRQPIQNIMDTVGGPPYTIQIRQPNHGLSIGDEVLFAGFITTLGIPDTALNTTHIVSNVIDFNNYEIIIDNINLVMPILDTKGGFAAKVYVPNIFRLLFDKSDMMGNELGFRNVGEDIAITKFNKIITNQDAYQNEVVTIDLSTGIKYVSIGSQLIPLTNNALHLYGQDYILMHVREFGGCDNVGENKNVLEYFAKIGTSDTSTHNTQNNNKILRDTFVTAPILFYQMFILRRLTLQFFGPDDKLYNFYGLDHSFVLEITSLELAPGETGINSNNNFA
jgi:hypothetical protein